MAKKKTARYVICWNNDIGEYWQEGFDKGGMEEKVSHLLSIGVEEEDIIVARKVSISKLLKELR